MSSTMTGARILTAISLVLVLITVGGCSIENKSDGGLKPGGSGGSKTTRVEVIEQSSSGGKFSPQALYEREAPGVVTVVSLFNSNPSGDLRKGDQGLGSGFVISANGEIATNAHVVTSGEGSNIRRAKEVYIQFGDKNQVQAKIVGVDPDTDVALLSVKTAGLTLRPLVLGNSDRLSVGEPVVAIGSPFGEPQSLSVGVISATDRSIDSLTGFAISGAIQTDAAINHGNSGGPLVNARGQIIGINSQIQSTGGGGEGVGFAVPVNTVKRSLSQLRKDGEAEHAYLGVATVPLYPQLVSHLKLPVAQGAYVQQVSGGSPASKAKLRAGNRKEVFQTTDYSVGGDIITKIDDHRITKDSDLTEIVGRYQPGDQVTVEFYRGNKKQTVKVKLAERPKKL